MSDRLAPFFAFLDRPLFFWSRFVLAALVIPLVLVFSQPLWRISMKAPQYPKGLSMDVYAHKVEGGHDGKDIKEINNLNHYIGMKTIDRRELTDLDWIPFALGLLALLTLRCAAIGNVRSLIDLLVVSGYIGVFAFGRFIYKLYTYGHDLDPAAPFKVKPFTPAILGSKQVANFTTTSWPQLGTYLMGVFVLGLTALTVAHLVIGRQRALRAGAAPTAVPA